MGYEADLKVIEVLPTGEYPAVLRDIEMVDSQYPPHKQLKFTFDLDNGTSLLAWASWTFSTASKLYRWVKQMEGHSLEKGYRLNTDDFLGRRVMLEVLRKRKKDSDDEFNRVEEVWKAPDDLPPPPEPEPLEF